jgi:ferredoxin-2, mitochondrial
MKVRFVSASGDQVREVEAKGGERLLDVAQANGQPLEGTCEGQMACSTCHVIVVPEDFDKLPSATADEDDLLDLAASVTRTSRLSCQIWLDESWGSLTVRIPPESRDMQGR